MAWCLTVAALGVVGACTSNAGAPEVVSNVAPVATSVSPSGGQDDRPDPGRATEALSQLVTAERRALASFAGQRAFAVAAIGHPEAFFAALREAGIDLTEHPLPDHAAIDATQHPPAATPVPTDVFACIGWMLVATFMILSWSVSTDETPCIPGILTGMQDVYARAVPSRIYVYSKRFGCVGGRSVAGARMGRCTGVYRSLHAARCRRRATSRAASARRAPARRGVRRRGGQTPPRRVRPPGA